MPARLCLLLLLIPLLVGLTFAAAPPSASRNEAKPPDAFRFTDVTAEAGLDKALYGAFNHAVAWGDFDGDGRLDLFLGNFADRGSAANYGLKKPIANQLFRQVKGGKFEPFPCPAVEVAMRCSGAAFVDLDNDGDLDLYVTSNTQVDPQGEPWQRAVRKEGCRLYRNDGGGKFIDVSNQSGACPADVVRCRDVGVLDYDGDGLPDLLVMQDRGVGEKDKPPGLKLFRNKGGLKFEDVSAKVGLPADLWGTGVAVADLDGDGRPDFYVCGSNRLYLSQGERNTYKECESSKAVFAQPEKELDWVTGASFGDLDGDGDLDLITGRHHYHGPSRVHVYLNEGLKKGEPQFREITKALGIGPLPQKAPHTEIQDFDNDGIPDLYWSAFFARGEGRWPFICKGLGMKQGLPRYDVPRLPAFDLKLMKENKPPEKGAMGMVYFVDGPAVDYDGDGRLDFFCGNWPPGGSRLFRNDTKGGNFLQVRIEGKKMNRMGVGAKVRLYAAGKRGDRAALLGCQEITLNGGYSSGRPAVAHFGLGKVEAADVEVSLPTRKEPLAVEGAKANRLLVVTEP